VMPCVIRVSFAGASRGAACLPLTWLTQFSASSSSTAENCRAFIASHHSKLVCRSLSASLGAVAVCTNLTTPAGTCTMNACRVAIEMCC
jgi:hypothetical protein